MNLAQFRQQYPQYNDMPDYELADSLYRKFYSDMPRQQYFQFIGMQDLSSDVPVLGTNTMPDIPERPGRPVGERVIGGLEAAGTMATGATSGAVGYVNRGLSQFVQEFLNGDFGSDEAADRIEQAALQGASQFTYQPRTGAGQEYVQDTAELLGYLPPVLGPTTGALPAGTFRAARDMARRPIRQNAPTPTRSIGAAELAQADYRRGIAERLPVPFKEDSALTTGQATRDFEQLRWERETAKRGLEGKPLRERMLKQNEVAGQNFNQLVEALDPERIEARDIGVGVNSVINEQYRRARQRVRNAYAIAEKAGDLEQPVNAQPLAPVFESLFDMEDVAPNIRAAKRAAVRLGIATVDENGQLVFSKMVPLKRMEAWRQVINDATDLGDRREARARRLFFNAIDSATQTAGGEAYRRARKTAANFFSEFENASLMRRLRATKPGTDERRVAFADVADNIIVNSPVEEINKFRGTLQRGSAEGQQLWRDLKAYGIEHIRRKAFGTQTDDRGNPVVKPDAFAKVIQRMDKEGKLEALYGKRGAQMLRDLQEVVHDISTVPPNAVNYSNTASVLMDNLAALVDLTVSASVQLPAPVLISIRKALQYSKDRALKRRIQMALDGKTMTRRGSR